MPPRRRTSKVVEEQEASEPEENAAMEVDEEAEADAEEAEGQDGEDDEDEGDGGEGDDEEGDEDDESDEEEEVLERKVLPQRITRGSRMSDMHGEGDDEFWEQEAFQELSDDEEYSVSEASTDVVDSDFDEPEDESDDGEQAEADAKEKSERKRGTRNVYVDPAAKRAPKRRKLAPASSSSASSSSSSLQQETGSEAGEGEEGQGSASRPTSTGGPGPIRRQSSRSHAVRQAQLIEERQRRRSTQPAREKKARTVRVWTQEELLAEAERNEAVSRAALERLLAIHQDQKALDTHEKPAMGPHYLWISRGGNGGSEIAFPQCPQLPTVLQPFDMSVEDQEPPPAGPAQTFCVVTGLPARYLDPVTQKPFASVNALRALRGFPPDPQFNEVEPPAAFLGLEGDEYESDAGSAEHITSVEDGVSVGSADSAADSAAEGFNSQEATGEEAEAGEAGEGMEVDQDAEGSSPEKPASAGVRSSARKPRAARTPARSRA